MNEKIHSQNITELMNNPGKCIGENIKAALIYLEKTKGKEGLDKFNEEMKKLGYPLNQNTIQPFDWYPIGLRALTFIALRRAFGWEEKDLEKFGKDLFDYSLVYKIIFKFFLSPKYLFNNAAKYWKKHFTVGKMEASQFSEKKKYGILRIYNFKVHPDFCLVFLGSFRKLGELSGKRNVIVEEVKCIYKGDFCHEYIIRWE